MTALTEFLFPAPARRTTLGIIKWWEKRRLAYNLLVGAAGTVTLTVFAATEWILAGNSAQLPPWQGVLVFAIGANVFYCLGPVVEWTVERLFKGEVLPVGPGLYRMGLTFAVGLALFPSLLAIISFLIRFFFVS